MTTRPPIDDPAKLAAWLRGRDLQLLPRHLVRDIFKAVDQRQDMVQAGGTAKEHAAWMEPWTILIDHIDPRHLIEWPLTSWDQVDEAMGFGGKDQLELFS